MASWRELERGREVFWVRLRITGTSPRRAGGEIMMELCLNLAFALSTIVLEEEEERGTS